MNPDSNTAFVHKAWALKIGEFLQGAAGAIQLTVLTIGTTGFAVLDLLLGSFVLSLIGVPGAGRAIGARERGCRHTLRTGGQRKIAPPVGRFGGRTVSRDRNTGRLRERVALPRFHAVVGGAPSHRGQNRCGPGALQRKGSASRIGQARGRCRRCGAHSGRATTGFTDCARNVTRIHGDAPLESR